MTSLQRAMWLLDEVLDELGGRSDTIEARKKIYRALDALAIEAEVVEESWDAVDAILGASSVAELNALMPQLSAMPEGAERDMARKVFSEHRETLRSRELAAVAEEAI